MSSPRFEAFLARLYLEADLRARVLQDPERTGLAEGLTPGEAKLLEGLDGVGLELAARSFEGKRRASHVGHPGAAWRLFHRRDSAPAAKK